MSYKFDANYMGRAVEAIQNALETPLTVAVTDQANVDGLAKMPRETWPRSLRAISLIPSRHIKDGMTFFFNDRASAHQFIDALDKMALSGMDWESMMRVIKEHKPWKAKRVE